MFGRKRLVDLHIDNLYNASVDVIEEQEDLWEALSELSALVEFLVEKQEKATLKAPSGSTKPQTSKGKTAPKTDSKATKKVAGPAATSRTKKK